MRGRGRRRSGPREVRAPRGTELSCRGWPQEAALRMLMNNLDPDVAERPDDLVVYGGTGRAARSWEAFDAIVRELRALGDDETLLVQSGKPVGVFRTHEWSPRVLIANSNLVGEWANWDEFRRLEALGLTMYGQMTAGSWIYIGSQGIVQGTYECFAEIARRRFGGSLAGTITLHRGARRDGRRAAARGDDERAASRSCIEVDPERIARRLETALPRRARRRPRRRDRALPGGEARSAARSASACARNAAEVFPELLRRGFEADVVTDQTCGPRSARRLRPAGLSLAEADELRERDPDEYIRRARAASAAPLLRHGRLLDAGAEVFDYGNSLRAEAELGGLRARLRLPRVRARLHPAAVLRGQGPVSLGGALGRSGRHRRHRPRRARGVPGRRGARALDPDGRASGSRSRGCRRGSAGSATASARRLGLRFNEMVRSGRDQAPIVIGRDHLDSRLGRLALPRDRVDGRTAPTRSPTGRC